MAITMSTTSSAIPPMPSAEGFVGGGGSGSGGSRTTPEEETEPAVETEDIEDDKDAKDSTVPACMSDCLECDDPVVALQRLSRSSSQRAARQAKQLRIQLSSLNRSVPELLRTTDGTFPLDHPLHTVTACADSVAGSLTKIASGGSEASQEIRRLEQEKRNMDAHAAALERALLLRKTSDRAAQSTQGSAWGDAAEALQPWLKWKDQCLHDEKDDDDINDKEKADPRVRMYTGEYALQQLQTTYDKLQLILLQNYERAVEQQDLHALGQLTPILSTLRLEQEALRFYKVYLQRVLETSLQQAIVIQPVTDADTKKNKASAQIAPPPPPYAPMGRVYNTAVATLRHHLPMVSHCLYKADGAAAVLQLVHVQVEDYVLPLLQQYQRDQQLARVARVATSVYAHLEERYTGRMVDDHNNNSNSITNEQDTNNDGGFAQQIGTLADVDASLQEAATVLQHSETYCRFLRHTCQEVRKARRLRHEHAVEKLRRERERHEWATGNHHPHREGVDSTTNDAVLVDDLPPFRDLPILPASTPLDQALAELGGQYAAIERCLLLASMHRALTQSNYDDPRFYRPMSTLQSSGAVVAAGTSSQSTAGTATLHHSHHQQLQTTLVDTCLFAARRGTQRAFATGHAGTASAMVNFTAECLTDVLVEVLATRAEEWGVHPLKPGEGLLVGNANYLTSAASQLMRQSVVAPSVVVPTGGVGSASAAHKKNREELERHQKQQQGLARACAVLNDLEVATHHTRQLEQLLHKTLDKSFAPPTAQQQVHQHVSEELQQQQHEVEQLRMCVKALAPVAEQMQAASDAAIESFESVLRPRIRSIVGDAVGSEASPASSAFMMGAATVGDRHRDTRHGMNYNLDEEAYNLLQLSEGYVARLCTLLDELLLPLQRFLAPRLWDKLLLAVVSTAGKRLEAALRKCHFTALGGLALDADMRDLLHYTKERLHAADSNPAIFKACPTLSRLLQVGQLLSVDDLEDVTDLIHSSKRKGLWDLKMDDVKALLSARVEFDAAKVDELLRD